MNRQMFVNEINQSTINIPRAALVFARTIAYPGLDVADYLRRIDNLSEAARSEVPTCGSLADRVDSLSEFLFHQMEFQGNHHDYYDPRNSYLNDVLDLRRGIPISLSLLWVTVAQRLGLPAYGVGLPGHFIAGVFEQGSEILIDPYNAGVRLTVADCDRLVRESTGHQGAFSPRWLTPVSPVDLLARMLTNLCHAYVRREDWQNAIPVIQHLLLTQPEIDWHLRDLGYVHLYNGSLRLSAQYLEEYLRRAPAAPDFDNVLKSLQVVAGRLALWN
jgi:regulator of sirC expression with transglutaminase-like and TPR domain